jgi:hypothetical protein
VPSGSSENAGKRPPKGFDVSAVVEEMVEAASGDAA